MFSQGHTLLDTDTTKMIEGINFAWYMVLKNNSYHVEDNDANDDDDDDER